MTFPYDNVRLQALIAEVDSAIENVRDTADKASRVQPRSSGLSQQDLTEIERHARSSAAPKELKELQRRVDAGELSWADIAAGRALDDEGVQRAFATGLPDLRRAYTAIEEGHDIEDIIASGQPHAAPTSPTTPAGSTDHDDDDEPPTVLKRGW
jgi:ribosomal protein L12E/L44/L45/RPP1/RPP2